jgi:NTP pyrophosphatase (non-canonical NTP hydrolase)
MTHGYSTFVNSLFVQKRDLPDGYMHAAAGMCGEAGEILEMVKKHWVYDRHLDLEKMVEEIGDLLFYTTAMCNLLGVSLSDCMVFNRAKLERRYPNGFSKEAALARADKQG